MAYTVFARKYRPQRFDEVVGQEAVGRTLKNALLQDRVAHAYLFAGPRGTGKTSMARILAKALNCAAPVDGEPCNRCDPCLTITAGRNFDVDEFDAASNRKVEDAERLLEQVRQPRPARADSKARVFIVDEVHMMSTTAFNALLKTLEEPPAHVKFIFATTEAEKVPDTILSRCQRFDFRRIGPDDAARRLAEICEAEGIEADPGALRLVVRRAHGGLRDAQSLLDQAVALAAEREGERLVLRGDRLEAALGVAPRERVIALLVAVVARDAAGVLGELDRIHAGGIDPAEVCAEAAAVARAALGLAIGGKAAEEALGDAFAAELGRIAGALGVEGALHVMSTLVDTAQRLTLARDDRLVVELAFVKLARLGDLVGIGPAITRLEQLEERLEWLAGAGLGGVGVPGPGAPGATPGAAGPRAVAPAVAGRPFAEPRAGAPAADALAAGAPPAPVRSASAPAAPPSPAAPPAPPAPPGPPGPPPTLPSASALLPSPAEATPPAPPAPRSQAAAATAARVARPATAKAAGATRGGSARAAPTAPTAPTVAGGGSSPSAPAPTSPAPAARPGPPPTLAEVEQAWRRAAEGLVKGGSALRGAGLEQARVQGLEGGALVLGLGKFEAARLADRPERLRELEDALARELGAPLRIRPVGIELGVVRIEDALDDPDVQTVLRHVHGQLIDFTTARDEAPPGVAVADLAGEPGPEEDPQA